MIDRKALLAVAFAVTLAGQTTAAPLLGQPAPAFKATDASGKTRSLAEFRGKTVVLEWTNNGCPYVQKHYNAGAMQKLQSLATRDGVVWLTVVSSAPGMQGFLTPAAAKAWKAELGAAASDVLLDAKGTDGSAALIKVRSRDVLFPVIVYPLLVPMFIMGIYATDYLIAEKPNVQAAWEWIGFLGIYNGAFLVVSVWTFDSLVIE